MKKIITVSVLTLSSFFAVHFPAAASKTEVRKNYVFNLSGSLQGYGDITGPLWTLLKIKTLRPKINYYAVVDTRAEDIIASMFESDLVQVSEELGIKFVRLEEAHRIPKANVSFELFFGGRKIHSIAAERPFINVVYNDEKTITIVSDTMHGTTLDEVIGPGFTLYFKPPGIGTDRSGVIDAPDLSKLTGRSKDIQKIMAAHLSGQDSLKSFIANTQAHFSFLYGAHNESLDLALVGQTKAFIQEVEKKYHERPIFIFTPNTNDEIFKVFPEFSRLLNIEDLVVPTCFENRAYIISVPKMTSFQFLALMAMADVPVLIEGNSSVSSALRLGKDFVMYRSLWNAPQIQSLLDLDVQADRWLYPSVYNLDVVSLPYLGHYFANHKKHDWNPFQKNTLLNVVPDFPTKLLDIVELAERLADEKGALNYERMARETFSQTHDEYLTYSLLWDAHRQKGLADAEFSRIRDEVFGSDIDFLLMERRFVPNTPNFSEKITALEKTQTENDNQLASPRLVRIYSTNSYGIKQDAEIFRRALGSELNVEIVPVSGSHEIDDGSTAPSLAGKALVNLFLEQVSDIEAIKHAKFNWLMVNQEYLGSPERLADINLVLCKTRYAAELMLEFRRQHRLKFQVYYTKFTTLAEPSSRDSKNFDLALHAAGKSPHKNTGSVLRLWQTNPGYPKLVVTCRNGSQDDPYSCFSKEALPVIGEHGLGDNVDLHSSVVAQETLQEWQETAGYFIVPSSVEGYGHYINEGRAHGAVVITTDAPPMNEMVEDGITGFVVPTNGASVVNQNSGALAHNIRPDGFEDVMKKVLRLSETEKLLIGKRAQVSFMAERRFFKNRIDLLVDSLIKHDDLSGVPGSEFGYPQHGKEMNPAASAESFDVFAYIPQKTFGIVITVFNRPEYLRQTFASLKNADLKDTLVIVVDDASTDNETRRLIQDLDLGSVPLYKIRNRQNSGVLTGLLRGFDLAVKNTKYVLNIDSDVVMSRNWLQDLKATHEKIADPNIILTGFNTKSHPTKLCDVEWCHKESIGGINFFMSSAFYESTFHPWFSGRDILDYYTWKSWDWTVVDKMRQKGYRFFATRPSVIQHIGFEGLNANAEKPADVADDFIGELREERLIDTCNSFP